MYIHAERLLAKAGGSKLQGEGDLPPLKRSEAGVERAERSGGLHKRSAEAWGNPLRARGAELPLGVLLLLLLFRRSGPALRAGTGPLRWVAEDRRGRRQGGDLRPANSRLRASRLQR